jgi:hypothetical protein
MKTGIFCKGKGRLDKATKAVLNQHGKIPTRRWRNLLLLKAEETPSEEPRQSHPLNSPAYSDQSFLVSFLQGVVLFEEGSELVEFLCDG